MRHSKKLEEIAATDRRFHSYHFEYDNGHWLDCSAGWINLFSGTHSIHESTVREVLSQIRDVKPCLNSCCVPTPPTPTEETHAETSG